MNIRQVGDTFRRVTAVLSSVAASIIQSPRPSAIENIRMFGYSNTRKEDKDERNIPRFLLSQQRYAQTQQLPTVAPH